MRASGYFHDSVDVFCTNTDKTVEADVKDFREGVYLAVTIQRMPINLQFNKQHNVYIGNMAGLEFTANAPRKIG